MIKHVLAIGELVAVARALDEEGSSPLALRLSKPWGCRQARFLRSSANHVFVCDVGVLRFRPGLRARAQSSAEAVLELAEAGAPVAPPLSGDDGLVVEAEGYVATMLAAVHGKQVDEESLTRELARDWGKALARLHDAASEAAPDVPRWLDVVREAAQSLELAEIHDDLSGLPITSETFGVVHGDPELDNVIWSPEPVFVDLDDVSRSWFAADIGFALRDFEGSPLREDFLAGYRQARPLTDDELSWLPLFRRAHAVVTLAGLERVLLEPVSTDWPDWALKLHARIAEIAARLRRELSLTA